MPVITRKKTLRRTYAKVTLEIVNQVILVDDYSQDRTTDVAQELGFQTICHEKTRVMAAIKNKYTPPKTDH